MSEPFSSRKNEPAFSIAPVVLALVGIMLAIHSAQVFLLSQESYIKLLMYGAFFPAAYETGSIAPTWLLVTSPVTYAFLHGSWAHVGINCLWLVVFGAPLALRLGTFRFLAFFAVTAIAAAALHFVFYPGSVSPLIGASGAVSGFTAAAARFGFSTNGNSHTGFVGHPFTLVQTFQNRTSLSFILIWFALNFLPAIISYSGDNIAWQAHIGGFLAGLFLLPIFDRR